MPTNTLIGRTTYNPAQVMLNAGQGGGSSSSPYVVGPESVRASGSGPFDAAYRQNLATYAGGNFARPGGQLNINPTGANVGWGSPSGGGNAPVTGAPSTLLQQALGGRPWQAQQPSQSPTQAPQSPNPLANWLEQYMMNGSNYGAAL